MALAQIILADLYPDNAIIILTHCGPLTANGDMDLGHHWLK